MSNKKIRMRRLRKSESLRSLFDLTPPPPEKFVWPVFLVSGSGIKDPINSMPGQYRYSVDKLIPDIEPLIKMGIKTILLFGVAENNEKDKTGTYAFSSEGTVQKAIPEIKKRYPELTIITDVCLCAYTDHGHCGLLDNSGEVNNDNTLEILSKVAVSHAYAGADIVAPSAMMDGQVSSIRKDLDAVSFNDTLIMSYSIKFASSMYGPFRDAEKSSPGKGDRKSYQQSPASLDQAIRESKLDEREGADILMVKPALFYLDVISKIKEKTNLPLAAYNVSGEYSMIHAMSQNGWGDLYPMARESIISMSRAGTDIFISYWANQYNMIFGAK